MVVAAFVAPFLLEATDAVRRGRRPAARGRLGLITTSPRRTCRRSSASTLAGHWRVDDALDPRQIAEAVTGLSGQLGRVERLVGALEQLQVPLAQVREALGIPGMDEADRASTSGTRPG